MEIERVEEDSVNFDCHISVLINTLEAVIRAICSRDQRGLLSRFLFTLPPFPAYSPAKEEGDNLLEEFLRNLYLKLRSYGEYAVNKQELILKFSQKALDLFNELNQKNHDEIAETSNATSSYQGWLGKYPNHLGRVAIVICLIEQATKNTEPEDLDLNIDQELLRRPPKPSQIL